ncbi:uncharacterized protein CIMG_04136 [Coccidioides immitis RS]|uniref:Uncharacterized protein n=4 Tax=Coccidioides immitis TaxID=5501 RepID=A0A0E1S362_COCIM|nr:uncharacterized protein CIMG_04136 [Coccidioides immitis RS]EAS33112.2 hypothetical protein CIMG_04136 [Coccidioides immitis RS]
MASHSIQLQPIPQIYDNGHVQLKVSGSLQAALSSAFASCPERLRATFENAWLWSDLCLSVAPQNYQVVIDEIKAGQVHVLLPLKRNFNYSAQLEMPRQQHLHSLVSCLDSHVQPPFGIPVVTVRHIEASFEFMLTESDSLGFAQNCYDLRRYPAAIPADVCTRSGLLFHYSLGDNAEESLSNPDEDWISLENDPTYSSQRSISSYSSDGYGTVAHLETSETGFPVKTVRCYASLLDLGLRNFLCHQPFRLEPDVEGGNTNENPDVLSNLASRILNLEYNRAIAQRISLIPVIAKGIHSLLSTTQSPELKSRLGSLARTYFDRYCFQDSSVSGTTNPTPDTRTILKCLLWTNAQNGLSSSNLMSKLSPLQTGIPCSISPSRGWTHYDSLPETKPTMDTPFEVFAQCLFDDGGTDEEELFFDHLDTSDGNQSLDGLLEVATQSPAQFSSPMLDGAVVDETLEYEIEMLDHSSQPSLSPKFPTSFANSDPILDDEDDGHMRIDADHDISFNNSFSSNITHFPVCSNEEMLF